MATMFANIMLRTTCDRLDRPSSYTVAKARLPPSLPPS
jgi:nuclear cap-binding protein subunit 2